MVLLLYQNNAQEHILHAHISDTIGARKGRSTTKLFRVTCHVRRDNLGITFTGAASSKNLRNRSALS